MVSKNIREIIGYVADHFKSLCIVLVALLSVSASLLSIGIVFRKLVDKGVSADQVSEIHNAIFLMIALIAIFAVGSFLRSYYINVITVKVISKLKSDTHRMLLKVNIAKYENLKVGDIISRLGSDIEVIGGLIINFLSFFIRNLIMLFGAVILMFVQSPKLSLFVVISVPILLVPLLKLSKHVRALSRSVLAEQGNLAANIDENFSGIRTLYAYNQQEYTANKFDDKIKSYIKHASIRLRLRSMFFALAIAIISGAIITVIWIGSVDIIEGRMSSGQMVSFIYYAIIVGMSAGGVAELFSEIQGPLAALDRVIELKDMVSLAQQKKVQKKLAKSFGIKFENVDFAYPARPDILALNNISLEIKHGHFTGIVGRSGSGKSTLMQLLLKFYKHKSGDISIGGLDINLINEDEIRAKIAYVEQYPTIFSGTIRSNIAFSNPNESNKKIDEIAKLCGITDFTKNLELGLDTEIGEKGVRISGGQKQRIAIARALLYKPEILMLDEATSALDNDSEKKILSNIRKLLMGKTIISIAHRVSSIENADEILVINQGMLAISGKHSDLLRSSKIYNLLYKEQERD
jgi:ATP-binding cassette, subfamily B, bacterial